MFNDLNISQGTVLSTLGQALCQGPDEICSTCVCAAS